MTATLVSGSGEASEPMGSSKWVKRDGRVKVDISGPRPRIVGELFGAGEIEGS